MAILGENNVLGSNEWYTPPHVFDALGVRFDMDVASPALGSLIVPWIPTDCFLTDDSLNQTWRGFIWMNPPFGGRNGLTPWLEKFFGHGDGIALVPDRTSAPWWQQYARMSDRILFVSPRLKFIDPDGRDNGAPAQGTCLFALGYKARKALDRASEKGLGILMEPV